MKIRLPSTLKYSSTSDLIRLGRDYDGGYVVSESDVRKADLLISLGIADDWSFEEDFHKLTRVPIIAYDGSVGKSFFAKQILKNIFRLDKPKLFFSSINNYLSYNSFFKVDKKHFENYVGLDFGKQFVSMSSILETHKNKKIFLKIDIEGSEYRILDSLINYSDNICGLAIEFHDCDINLKKIENFISAFPHEIIHIHANNYSPVNFDIGIPLSLEITFSSTKPEISNFLLPHDLDMPNNNKSEEIKLFF
ncbi:MAG: FkbM family methyltransferase [Gammaproteobacteria bacterium]